MWFWNPSKEDIKVFLESKEKEFVEKENRNPKLSREDQLERYVFFDLDKVFFATFPTELHASLSRLTENKTSSHSDKLAEWTPEAIQRLKNTYNSISRAMDFCLKSLLEGFLTKFAVDTVKAYRET